MKKLTAGLLSLFLLLITSCEVPQSFKVIGHPGLYVPLGSPFAKMEKEKRLDYLVSRENIEKMMWDKSGANKADADVIIYEAGEDLIKAYIDHAGKVQTYLARYPLAEMELDLKRYVEKAMDGVNKDEKFTIPGVPVLLGNPTYITEDGPEEIDNNKPFVRIPLKDMVKLVKSVTKTSGGIFVGLVIDYTTDRENNLKLKIPGFGINDFIKGEPIDDDGNPSANPTKLLYSNPAKKTFYPRDPKNGTDTPDLDVDANLLIYAQISAAFTEQTLTPQIIFDWEEATIDTRPNNSSSMGSFMGDYPLNNNLGDFLGEDVSFKTVLGYMYMSGGVGTNNSSMTINILDSDGQSISNQFPKDAGLESVDPPEFPQQGELFTSLPVNMSLNEPLHLEQILNPNSKTLKVGILIEEMKIYKAQIDVDQSIKFDLLVMIPMDLTVKTPAPNNPGYVKLDLGDSFNKDLWEGDLFGRKEEDENNYLKKIESFKLGMIKTNINILEQDKLAVSVTTKGGDPQIMEFHDNAFIELINPNSNGYLYSPTFTVLLKQDSPGSGSGSLRILRSDNPSFDFKLFVEAKAELEYTNNFGE